MNWRTNPKSLENMFDESSVRIEEASKVVSIPKDSVYSIEQVRTNFDEEKLRELAASLEENGQIQPIIVDNFDGKGYRIQKGERRWRAIMLSESLTHIECIVKERSTGDIFGQLVENIQRENLDPLELGTAFSEAKKIHDINNKELAQRLGKSEAFVSKHLKAIEAPQFILQAFQSGAVTDVESINALRIASQTNERAVKSLLASGQPISRKEALDIKDDQKDKPEKTTNPPAKRQTKNQKVTSIAVEVEGRTGLVFASGKHADKLTVLFDDGELEQVSTDKVNLVGYRL